jgi:uncharacterized membrane-anchored protein YhcB (DUF1043 family)
MKKTYFGISAHTWITIGILAMILVGVLGICGLKLREAQRQEQQEEEFRRAKAYWDHQQELLDASMEKQRKDVEQASKTPLKILRSN